jgi:hypothetical protein
MNIISRLEELMNSYNVEVMDAFVESLTPAERERHKQEIIDTYDTIYSYVLYDIDCDRVSDPESFLFFLLEIIQSVQRFFPDQLYFLERGSCYQTLADRTAAYEDKVRYIEAAISLYNTAPQTTEVQVCMVQALTDKMEITKQFTKETFTELLLFFRPLLNDTACIKTLIFSCFRVRSLPFEQNLYWYQCLLNEFEAATYTLAEKDPLVYLEWTEAYQYILFNDMYTLAPEYKATMVAQTALLLKPLEGYYTADTELLNRLGKAFSDVAKRAADNALKLEYYSIAVDFFTKGHELRPAAWTFPTYATNALLGMAHIYYEQNAYGNLINAFEHGIQLFSQVHNHEEDFQVNIAWGDFLLQYTGLAYEYKSPSINSMAEDKLLQAAALGNNYYSHPYYSLARLAIKSGDKAKAVQVLLECRAAIRSTGYDNYDLSDAMHDEDFREIWEELI